MPPLAVPLKEMGLHSVPLKFAPAPTTKAGVTGVFMSVLSCVVVKAVL